MGQIGAKGPISGEGRAITTDSACPVSPVGSLVVKVLVVTSSRVEVDEGSEGRNLGISHERSSNGLKEDEIKSHRLV